MNQNNHQQIVNFIWSIANLLRDDFKRAKYPDVILPLTVLRRLDAALEDTKADVLVKYEKYKGKLEDMDGILKKASGYNFYNTSQYDFKKLLDDPKNIGKNLRLYINAYSPLMREIIDKFKFNTQIDALEEANLTYQVIEKFSGVEMHPDRVSNLAMGYVFEELIRKFNEASNENPGEHFTPREIIRLMVNLLFSPDLEILKKQRIIKTIYDPACGSGGMLTEAKEWILESVNDTAQVEMFGQEVNPETFAVAKSDLLIKGENADNIKFGSTLSHDHLFGETFDYMLSNPPYGKEWKKDQKEIEKEAELGFQGRFGAGLPRISDGQLLFLQTMLAKMKPSNGGSRIAIVMNGSPLFTGDAGSGESEIRRSIIENDWLETIIALPNQLFYNTGIHTYIWVLTNRKKDHHKGKVKLINAVLLYEKMRKSLGDKRNVISDEQIQKITELTLDGKKSKIVKVFPNEFFGYRKITIERPLKLNFQASAERLEKLKAESAFQNLAKSKKRDPLKKLEEEKAGFALRISILKALATIGNTLYKNQDKFIEVLEQTFKKADLKPDAPVKKAILKGLSERDETADVITDKKGNPEPDVDLRDYENVPLGEDIKKYFAREVLPHVPDAWISEDKKYCDHKDGRIGKVGYKISFTRYFYEYKPLRPLNEITGEIKKLENEITGMLRAVTKGFIQQVKMKSSGIDWLGDIPGGWEVKRYKNVLKIFQGMAFKSNDYVEYSDVISIRMGNIKKSGLIDLEHNTKYLPDNYVQLFKDYILRENDLVIAMTDMSPSLDFLAVPALMKGLDMNFSYLLNQRVGKLITNKQFNAGFLKYLLLSKVLRDQLKSLGLGTVQSNMSSEDLGGAFFASPSIPEQKAIVDFLDKETSKIDEMMKKVETQIEKLQEYRQALITSAVTGKIKV